MTTVTTSAFRGRNKSVFQQTPPSIVETIAGLNLQAIQMHQRKKSSSIIKGSGSPMFTDCGTTNHKETTKVGGSSINSPFTLLNQSVQISTIN